MLAAKADCFLVPCSFILWGSLVGLGIFSGCGQGPGQTHFLGSVTPERQKPTVSSKEFLPILMGPVIAKSSIPEFHAPRKVLELVFPSLADQFLKGTRGKLIFERSYNRGGRQSYRALNAGGFGLRLSEVGEHELMLNLVTFVRNQHPGVVDLLRHGFLIGLFRGATVETSNSGKRGQRSIVESLEAGEFAFEAVKALSLERKGLAGVSKADLEDWIRAHDPEVMDQFDR